MERVNSGCGHKWVLSISSTCQWYRLPVKRSRYYIGVKEIFFKGLPVDINIFHIVLSPNVSGEATYANNGRSISAIKTVIMEGQNVKIDFSDHMEYYVIDFLPTETLQVTIMDNDGKRIDSNGIQGIIVLHMVELK